MSRPLALHVSALNDAEFALYTAAILDISEHDPADVQDYDKLDVGVREARAWLRGRYNDLPVQQIDSILNAIAPANVHAGRLSAGQFFAVMRLVMHVRTGKEPDPSLVFVQGKQCPKVYSTLLECIRAILGDNCFRMSSGLPI